MLWLKRSRTDASGDNEAPPADRRVSRLAKESRRELLDAIAGFVVEQDLPVTPEILSAVCQALSGASPSLARRISARAADGEKITPGWLREAAPRPPSTPEDEESRKLSQELDHSLREFARSTSDARSAAGVYRSQLTDHAAALEQRHESEPSSQSLAVLARQMAERAHVAEEQLRASEREAQALRRRLDRARREAEHDHLTGLPNRRAFEAELQRQYAETKAARERLCVAFCDVDHFKQVNDQHGHEAGDRILKRIAEVLASISGETCHVARHGGEEFVLLFRGCTVDEAAERLDDARVDLSHKRLINRETSEPIGQVTFSAGVADAFAFPTPSDALRAADEALFQAKEQGRNRIVAARAH